jgi:1,5-anhydro-D-fructose reductase (1,5-anhydro-D-mannitol-forming)
MVRWGIIGLGKIADTEIAPAITASSQGELRGVVSRDPGRAEAFAVRHGAERALTSLDELLADPGVDAVYIATPNALHAGGVVAAARAGKHVMCDKPLALSVADARRAVASCEQAGVRLGITFQTRFHDNFGRFRELVQDGSLGEILAVPLSGQSRSTAPARPSARAASAFAVTGRVLVSITIRPSGMALASPCAPPTTSCSAVTDGKDVMTT